MQKNYFWFTSLSKILDALLVTFTAEDRFFERFWAADETSYKKRCWPYFKIVHNCSRTRSEDQFLYASFSAPHFWLVPPHFVCSGNGTGLGGWAKSHIIRKDVTKNFGKEKTFYGTKMP